MARVFTFGENSEEMLIQKILCSDSNSFAATASEDSFTPDEPGDWSVETHPGDDQVIQKQLN